MSGWAGRGCKCRGGGGGVPFPVIPSRGHFSDHPLCLKFQLKKSGSSFLQHLSDFSVEGQDHFVKWINIRIKSVVIVFIFTKNYICTQTPQTKHSGINNMHQISRTIPVILRTIVGPIMLTIKLVTLTGPTIVLWFNNWRKGQWHSVV